MLPERWGAAAGVPELCVVGAGLDRGSWILRTEPGCGNFFFVVFQVIQSRGVPLPMPGDHRLVIVPPRRLDGREQSGGNTSLCD